MATSWAANSPRPWSANHLQLDSVVLSLSRLESSVDELRHQVEMLPDVLKSTLGPKRAGTASSLTFQQRASEDSTSDDTDAPSNVPQLEESEALMYASPTTMQKTIRPTRMMTTAPAPKPCEVHKIFEERVARLESTKFQDVQDLGRALQSQSASGHEVSAGWNGRWEARIFLLHPASRICACLDALRMMFLMVDAFYVPYSLAYDNSLEGGFLYLASFVVCFWTFELMLNFLTGYMKPGGGVVMRWELILSRYLRGGFIFDLIAVVADAIQLAAGLYPEQFSGGSALESVRAVRLLKLSRLIRAVAKMNAGFTAQVRSNCSNFIQKHGWVDYEHYFRFTVVLTKLTFIIAWIGHVGSCIWYKAGDTIVKSDDSAEWFTQERTDLNYRLGLYWAITTMFSGASPVPPENTSEVAFAVAWVSMGAMFVTSFTSTLAATLIDANERQKEITKKNRVLAAFMGQRKTPAVLAVRVHTDFFEKVRVHQPVMESEIKSFLEILEPELRANLRECHYGRGFLKHGFFRMLKLLDDQIVKTICFKGSHCMVLKSGERMFPSGNVMPYAALLASGTMCYTYFSTRDSGREEAPSVCGTSMTNMFQVSSTARRTSQNLPVRGSTDSLQRGTVKPVREDDWICELALLVSWTTVGSLEAEGPCELLLVSADTFTRLVTAKPSLEATVSSYAVQVSRLLCTDTAIPPTDIQSGIDCDVVVCGLHPAIRGPLISMPVLKMLRRQMLVNQVLRRRKPMQDLQTEVQNGKCHLSISADGEVCRVVLLVALRLVTQDGRLCILLAEKKKGADGQWTPTWRLPGRKVEGTERPEDAVAKLLQADLAPLAPAIQLEEAKTVVEYNLSASFGLRTKYIRIEFEAVLMSHMVLNDTSPLPPLSPEDSLPDAPHRVGSAASMIGYATSSISQTRSLVRRSGRSNCTGHVRTANSSSAASRGMRMMRLGGKLGVSDSDVHNPSVFTSGPFPLEGPYHAFAIMKLEKGDKLQHKWVTEDGSALEDLAYNIYRWMDPGDFQTLLPRRADIEKEVRGHPLTPQHLSRLTHWSLVSRRETELTSIVLSDEDDEYTTL